MPTPTRSQPAAPIDQKDQAAPSPALDDQLDDAIDNVNAGMRSFDDAVAANETYWRSHLNDPKDEQRRLARVVLDAIADIRGRLERNDRLEETIVAVLGLGECLGLFPFVDRIRGGEGPRAGGKTGGETRGAEISRKKAADLQRIKQLAHTYRKLYPFEKSDDEHGTSAMAGWITSRITLKPRTVSRHLRALGLK